MKYKTLGVIAALGCALMLSQTGCGTQTTSSAPATNGGTSSAQSNTPSSSDSGSTQGSSQTPGQSSSQTGSSASTTSSSTSSSGTSGSSSNSGSSSSTGSSQTSTQTTSSGSTSSLPSRAQWELASKYYVVQGTIVSINQSAGTLHSLQIKVSKNVKGPTTSDTDPNFPFKVGSTSEFLFEQPLTDKGVLNPKVGDEVELQVGQYAIPGNKNVQWASEFKNYFFQKDGSYYDYQGKAVPAE